MFLNGDLLVVLSVIVVGGYVSFVCLLCLFVMLCVFEFDEILGIVVVYCKGVENVKVVGFDGVEIYGVNGYLFD